ncbi:8-oxo-dGTP pyrophosphatase MutT, NUDIX family [Paracoccus isoporae]|uniref:8-oxo-dGTP pyrophosphatase MutT, NUDIX family n=1 Tax=Paracoccus isoporae TaxID=591205 RepID=A0A1G6WUT0_9RHOB|nr:NUDIX domain-containing protein [Paracoccus isoporae]SDD69574.1 8-oxo-dGTP pyrophosphatase MutT, NUDIX family [Paracoccus isoporae]
MRGATSREDRAPDIYIAAAALMRPDGATLLVRKRGSTIFMQPGGKIEPGEAPLVALFRELGEELGLSPTDDGAVYLGRFDAPAALEDGNRVIAELYRVETADDLAAHAEIEEIRWLMPPERGSLELAPLTRDIVLPAIWNMARAV